MSISPPKTGHLRLLWHQWASLVGSLGCRDAPPRGALPAAAPSPSPAAPLPSRAGPGTLVGHTTSQVNSLHCVLPSFLLFPVGSCSEIVLNLSNFDFHSPSLTVFIVWLKKHLLVGQFSSLHRNLRARIRPPLSCLPENQMHQVPSAFQMCSFFIRLGELTSHQTFQSRGKWDPVHFVP